MPKAKTPRTPTASTTRIKQALPTPEFKSVAEPRKTQPKAFHTDAPVDIQAEIRRRAYELYEERGYTPGYEQEDWVVAEREVLARYSLQTV
jgi:hypothetical protein